MAGNTAGGEIRVVEFANVPAVSNVAVIAILAGLNVINRFADSGLIIVAIKTLFSNAGVIKTHLCPGVHGVAVLAKLSAGRMVGFFTGCGFAVVASQAGLRYF